MEILFLVPVAVTVTDDGFSLTDASRAILCLKMLLWFQSLLSKMTLSAAVRLISGPPALVLSQKILHSGSELKDSFGTVCR